MLSELGQLGHMTHSPCQTFWTEFPPKVYFGNLFSISCSVFIFWSLDNSHCSRSEMMHHSYFYMYSLMPSDTEHFFMIVNALYLSVQLFCSFFNWMAYFCHWISRAPYILCTLIFIKMHRLQILWSPVMFLIPSLSCFLLLCKTYVIYLFFVLSPVPLIPDPKHCLGQRLKVLLPRFP